MKKFICFILLSISLMAQTDGLPSTPNLWRLSGSNLVPAVSSWGFGMSTTNLLRVSGGVWQFSNNSGSDWHAFLEGATSSGGFTQGVNKIFQTTPGDKVSFRTSAGDTTGSYLVNIIGTFGITGNTNIIGVTTMNTSAANAQALTVRGTTAQSANIFEVQNVSNDVQFAVSPSGTASATDRSFANDAYGSVYIADANADTISVTSTTTPYTVGAVQNLPAGGVKGYKWTSGGVLKNVTVQDSSLTVGKAGKYEISYSFSFQTVSGVVNGIYNFYIYVDDVKQEKTGAKRLMSGTNDLGVGAVAPTVISLTAGQVIKLKVISVSDNSNIVTFQYAVLHVKRIDI